MSSSLIGKTSRVALCALLALAGSACAADDDDPDFHIGHNNVPGGAGAIPGGGTSVDVNNATQNNTNNTPDTREQLPQGEVLYIDGPSGAETLRSLNFDTSIDHFVFAITDLTGARTDLRDGDYAITRDRTRILYAPESAAPQPLLVRRVNGDAPFALVEASAARGVIRHPRVTADGAVLFTAGTYDADGTPNQTSLYRAPVDTGGSMTAIDLRLNTCQVIRDIAAHPTQANVAYGVLDACADLLDAGLVEIRLNTGATTPLLTLLEPDPSAALGLPVLTPDGRELLVVGRGSYDSNADFISDASGAGIFRIAATSGEFIGVLGFENPGTQVAGVTALNANTLVVDLDRGRRDLYLGDLHNITRITDNGTSRSPLAVP